MPETVDAVVIGGGHNGLVAAILLADAGWDVVVCEAADHAGGAVASTQLAPGWTADLFSAFYPLGAASPILRRLDLEPHGLRWVNAPKAVTHILEDGRGAAISTDVEETAASLDTWAPGDGDAWRALADQWQQIRDGVLGALFTPFPPVRAATGLLRTLGVPESLRLLRFALTPVRRFVEETFRGEGAGLLFAGNALHSDVTPDGAGSAVFGWLLVMLAQDVGFPVPQGGAARLIDALVSRLYAAGGRLRLGTRVDKVIVQGGRAAGVRTADGSTLRARRAVLANTAAPSLLLDLVGEEHLRPRTIADLRRFQWDTSTLKLNWGLSAPIPWKAPAAVGSGTVHLGCDLHGLTRYASDLSEARLPRDPFLLFGQMTTADPTRSPEGTESAWAYTHVPRPMADDAAAMAAHVERVEQVVEAHAPGFRDLVVHRLVQPPCDLQADDSNLSRGAVNGGTANVHQQLVFRPIPGTGRPEMPIDRLYLASAGAHPGGGVHGAPGSIAAQAALLGTLRHRAWQRALRLTIG